MLSLQTCFVFCNYTKFAIIKACYTSSESKHGGDSTAIESLSEIELKAIDRHAPMLLTRLGVPADM
jgi:hypothetical protein